MPRQVIAFHHTLRDAAGHLLDTSQGGPPVVYLEGSGTIIDGLEHALRGRPAGTKTRVAVPAARAYGERDECLVRRVKRDSLPVADLVAGDRFQTGPDRQAPIVTVLEVKGDDVLLDANHPLAGVDLDFEVEIVTVRTATPREIASGAADEPGRA